MDYEKERKSASSQEREMQNFWIKIWEDFDGLVERNISVEVEHVKAHGTKKEKDNVSLLEKVRHGRQREGR